MPLKHLSQKDIHNCIDDSDYAKKNDDIRQHLLVCEECRQKLKDYKVMISEIKRIRIFEPNDEFVSMVTTNLPDKYTKKEKPLLEIFSIITIFIPFGIVVSFLFHSNKLKLSSLGKIVDTISSLTYKIYNSLNSFRFIHDNIDTLGLLVFYMLVFSILNWLFIYSKLKKIYL